MPEAAHWTGWSGNFAPRISCNAIAPSHQSGLIAVNASTSTSSSRRAYRPFRGSRNPRSLSGGRSQRKENTSTGVFKERPFLRYHNNNQPHENLTLSEWLVQSATSILVSLSDWAVWAVYPPPFEFKIFTIAEPKHVKTLAEYDFAPVGTIMLSRCIESRMPVPRPQPPIETSQHSESCYHRAVTRLSRILHHWQILRCSSRGSRFRIQEEFCQSNGLREVGNRGFGPQYI